MKRSAAGAPSIPVSWAHLAVLWSFAFAQPLFDILADSPEFFVARENTSGDIVVLALAVTLVPPTLLILAELLLVRAPRVREVLHLAFVGLLAAALALQLLKDLIGGSAALLIPLALALGAAGLFAYIRLRPVPTALTVLAPVPLLFVLLFLFASPVSDLVLPESSDASEARADTGRTVPIVMLVFDEFSGASLMEPGGRIDSSRYPNFARLARDATWYRNATTVADYTSQAVPAILTGLRPEKGQLPIPSDHPDSLFTFLGEDYSLNVEEPVTQLCPAELCREERRPAAERRLRELVSDLSIVSLHRLLPDELADDLPAVDQTFGGFGDNPAGAGTAGRAESLEERTRVFRSFLRRTGSRQARPTLDFIHTELPHIPWNYLPNGHEYATDAEGLPGVDEDRWSADTRLIRQGEQRYLLQVGYVDRLLGRLLDRLRRTGLYERALVIVTADHGVAFQPELSRRAIAGPTFEEIASVPLFVKAPGQRRGGVDDSAARTIDILPTIADHLGTELPWRSDGRSLREPAPARDDSLLVYAKYGPAFTLPFADYVRRRDAVVRRVAGTYGARDHGRGVFAVGSDFGLIGQPVDRIPGAPPLRARAELDDPRPLASVDPRAASLPVFVAGSLSGLGPSRRVAVALNGRVAAVTESEGDGGTRFEAIVDPAHLRAGANTIELFELGGAPGAWRLAPLEEVLDDYRLVGRPGSESLVHASGRRLPVAAGAVEGFVETLEFEDGLLRISGWSATERRGAAEEVVAFVDGRFLVSPQPSTPRADVAGDHGLGALHSGFSIATPLDRRPDPAEVRVFGVQAGRASELRHLDQE